MNIPWLKKMSVIIISERFKLITNKKFKFNYKLKFQEISTIYFEVLHKVPLIYANSSKISLNYSLIY